MNQFAGDQLAKQLVNCQHEDMELKDSEQKALLQPYDYILKCGGKQVRTKLIQAFNHWLNIDPSHLSAISEIVEMLHNASLLIDDIEDDSILRRGIPVAHTVFGVASTINSANYVYFLALEKVINKLPQELTATAVKIFTEQLLELHRGQGLAPVLVSGANPFELGMDIYWRDNFRCPHESEYIKMIRRKTGGLFGLGVRLMQMFSPDKRDFLNVIKLMGVFFQIRDDYCNLNCDEYRDNKSYCEDLTEGKYSFPIVHAIRSNPDIEPQLTNILRQRTKSVELKKYAVDLMRQAGSFEYSIKTLKGLDEEIRAELDRLGGNPYLLALLNELNKQLPL